MKNFVLLDNFVLFFIPAIKCRCRWASFQLLKLIQPHGWTRLKCNGDSKIELANIFAAALLLSYGLCYATSMIQSADVTVFYELIIPGLIPVWPKVTNVCLYLAFHFLRCYSIFYLQPFHNCSFFSLQVLIHLSSICFVDPGNSILV